MKLTRDIQSPDFTLGKLLLPDNSQYSTCEDAIREVKIPGKTAIPSGKYKVIINFSNRFQKHMPLLLDVPGFSGVRIHAGNTAADTEGCILIGTARKNGGVVNSRFAFDDFFPRLQALINSGDNWLEII